MSNINELFVPYAESLELKELGFDEPCLAVHYEHKCYQYTKARGIKTLIKQVNNGFAQLQHSPKHLSFLGRSINYIQKLIYKT